MGPESEISGLFKNLKPEKIDFWAKFNRHIHVLVIPKFGGAQYILKGRSALGNNDHPIKTNTTYITSAGIVYSNDKFKCLAV